MLALYIIKLSKQLDKLEFVGVMCIMVDFNYLDKLITEVNDLRNKVGFYEVDTSSCSFSYMPRKKTTFVGYKQGHYDNLVREQKGMKESDKLRATAKDYLRFIKNNDNETIQIEAYINGRIDCLFQVYWVENKRYLFPFFADGGHYPTYAYVTCYDGNSISEEYMVTRNQIIYEVYSHITDTEIVYRRVNYVSGGNHPVLETSEGILHLNPLSYEEMAYDNWLKH